MSDPCESRKDIEKSDPIRLLLTSLFIAWYELFGDQPIKVKDLVERATNINDDTKETQEQLHEALSELTADNNKDAINKRSLAKKLLLYKNRIESGFRLEQRGTHQGTSLWCIKKI